MVAAQRFFEGRDRDRTFQIDGNREGMAVKDRSVDDLKGERRPVAGCQRIIVPSNARRTRNKAYGCVFPKSRKQVESDLGVVEGAGQALKAEQADGLLVQLV